jgi:hypothetical protein
VDAATAALASYGLSIWNLEWFEANHNNYHCQADSAAATAALGATAAALGLHAHPALATGGDHSDEPGWDDPELEALSAQWHQQQLQQRECQQFHDQQEQQQTQQDWPQSWQQQQQQQQSQQQQQQQQLDLGLIKADDDSSEPGWDDPELEALAAQWHHQQAQRRLSHAYQAGGVAPSP